MTDVRQFYARRPFFFGGPFLGGFLGGVLGSALFGPRPIPYYYYPPFFGFGYGFPYFW
jgi:hypothetical protein